MNHFLVLAFIIIFSGLGLVYYIFLNTPKGSQLWGGFFHNINKSNIDKSGLSFDKINYKNIVNNFKTGNEMFFYNTGILNSGDNKNIVKLFDSKKQNNKNFKGNILQKNKTNIFLKEILEDYVNDFIPSQLPEKLIIFSGVSYKVYYNNHGFFLLIFFETFNCNDLFNKVIYKNKKLVEIEDKKVIISNTLPGDKICFFNIDKFYGKKVFMYIFGKKYRYFVIIDKNLYYKLKPYLQKVFK